MQKCSNMAMTFEFDELEELVVLRGFFRIKGNIERSTN